MDQAEQLRNIVKLNNTKKSKIARVITITSGKGGVGKSNTSINIAMQLKKMGHRVILIDADFGLANIEVMLGIVPRYNLSDIIFHGKNIKDVISMGPMDVGFVSGGSGMNHLLNLTKTQINILINNLSELDELADYIIIDTGAGISDNVMEFVTFGSEVLVVITPEPTSLMDAYSLIKTLAKNPNFDSSETNVRIITNRVRNESEGKMIFDKLELVVKKFIQLPISFLGVVLEDENISKSVIKQQPISILSPHSKAVRSFEQIAKILNGDDLTEKAESKKGVARLFSNFIKSQKYK